MILKGDCIEVMKAIKPNSVDAIVCDPPYGLEFMGKEWDKLWTERPEKIRRRQQGYNDYCDSPKPCYKAGLDGQRWHTQWLTEAYRVLKPGGSMLVMGGTRTSHRLACAIEDSGFTIKDTLMWIYGSGFPKAQDLGKMIDKRAGKKGKVVGKRVFADGTTARQTARAGIYSKEKGQAYITLPSTDLAKHWDGFKVGGIKPAYEPIIWAVKPPEGSYVDNVLKYGVGAVNVEETRISTQPRTTHKDGNYSSITDRKNTMFNMGDKYKCLEPKGRFPANVILSHHPECVQVGVERVKGKSSDYNWEESNNDNPTHITKNIKSDIHHGDETVESWDCHPDCAVRLLDEQSGDNTARGGKSKGRQANNSRFFGKDEFGNNEATYNDSGGASRFFYCAKASRGERNAGLDELPEKNLRYEDGRWNSLEIFSNKYTEESNNPSYRGKTPKHQNNHPTVKPIKLFEYLIKLVTREGQIILDPFIGSGTTSIAAHNTSRKCIGIEKEDEYLEIAKRRIDYWKSQPQQLALGE